MIFLGLLYPPEDEADVLSSMRHAVSNAPVRFQKSLLDGLHAVGVDPQVVNVLPVGTWPRQYREAILPSKEWTLFGRTCYQLGGVNVPLLKQLTRERGLRRRLRKLIKSGADREILIYTPYLPFLRAVRKLPADVHITLIVTDLPEYYDLGRTPPLRRLLRKLNNRLIYDCLARMDRFVLLTEAMKEPMRVGDRPYVVVEGICNGESAPAPKTDGQKQVIFYSGTLHARFGIPDLLEAFRAMDRDDTELWLCGDGDAREAVEKAAEADGRIRYFGFVFPERVQELRAQATVLVNPRRNEGDYTKYSFPSKTMEYMAGGIPVVMHKLDGIPPEYDPYLFYVQENTPAGLREALEAVLDMDPAARARFGAEAGAFVRQNKNQAAQARKIQNMIRP